MEVRGGHSDSEVRLIALAFSNRTNCRQTNRTVKNVKRFAINFVELVLLCVFSVICAV